MNEKKVTLSIIILIVVGGVMMATPVILKAIPPRYAYRLPQPLRDIALPVQSVALLPTAAVPANVQLLLPTVTMEAVVSTKEVVSVDATAVISSSITPTPSPSPTPIPIPPAHRLANPVPHKFQTWNNCGPATLAMALSSFGTNWTQEQTAVVLKPNVEDRNVTPKEMVAFVNDRTDLHAIARVNGDMDKIRRLIAADIPVILEIGIEPPGDFSWMGWYGHYLLIVAYDDVQEQFWVYDSWFGTSEEPFENATDDGRALTYAELEQQWPHFNRNYIVVYDDNRAETAVAVIGTDLDDEAMWTRALQTVQTDTQSAPDNAFYWFNLGTIYNALHQYDNAALAYDQARAIGLPWRMLWYQFGVYEAYYKNGRYEDVILLADTTLKDRPYFEESFYYRGIARAAMGDEAEARRDLENALEFNPNLIINDVSSQ